MNDIKSTCDVLSNSLGHFADYLQKINDWMITAGQYRYPSVLPGVSLQTLKQHATDIYSSNTSFTDNDFTEYVKNDFSNVGLYKGHIELNRWHGLLPTIPNTPPEAGRPKK